MFAKANETIKTYLIRSGLELIIYYSNSIYSSKLKSELKNVDVLL